MKWIPAKDRKVNDFETCYVKHVKNLNQKGSGYFNGGMFVFHLFNETVKDFKNLLIADESPNEEILTDPVNFLLANALKYCNEEQLKSLYQSLKERVEPNEEEGWISVKDRLPEDKTSNSVYCLVYDSYDGIVVRPFNQEHLCWDDESGDDYYTDAKGGKITHWRPLPDNPKAINNK